jgi:hypothetical protein
MPGNRHFTNAQALPKSLGTPVVIREAERSRWASEKQNLGEEK